jgi:hypothetical protein
MRSSSRNQQMVARPCARTLHTHNTHTPEHVNVVRPTVLGRRQSLQLTSRASCGHLTETGQWPETAARGAPPPLSPAEFRPRPHTKKVVHSWRVEKSSDNLGRLSKTWKVFVSNSILFSAPKIFSEIQSTNLCTRHFQRQKMSAHSDDWINF